MPSNSHMPQFDAGAAVGLVLFFAGAVEAQIPQIETDAPERAVAGCYVLLVDEWGSFLREAGFFLPDTLRLALEFNSGGAVTQAIPRGSETWRDTGWRLRLEPNAYPTLEGVSAYWRVSAEGRLMITWLGRNTTHGITASRVDGRWEGVLEITLPRRLGLPNAPDTVDASLKPVSCPPPEYFVAVVHREWARRGW